MKNPRTTDHQTDAGAASEEAIGRGSVGGSLLIPEGDELDAEGDAGFGHLDDGDADDAEDDLDVERLEGLGDELGAVLWGSHWEGGG